MGGGATRERDSARWAECKTTLPLCVTDRALAADSSACYLACYRRATTTATLGKCYTGCATQAVKGHSAQFAVLERCIARPHVPPARR